jgi:hypothetical protein
VGGIAGENIVQTGRSTARHRPSGHRSTRPEPRTETEVSGRRICARHGDSGRLIVQHTGVDSKGKWRCGVHLAGLSGRGHSDATGGCGARRWPQREAENLHSRETHTEMGAGVCRPFPRLGAKLTVVAESCVRGRCLVGGDVVMRAIAPEK